MSQIVNIPIAQVRFLNPRARSKAKFSEIVSNIVRADEVANMRDNAIAQCVRRRP